MALDMESGTVYDAYRILMESKKFCEQSSTSIYEPSALFKHEDIQEYTQE